MGLLSRTDKLELTPKGVAKVRGVVPHYLKTTAPLWTIRREGCNDGMPSSLQSPPEAREIRRTVILLGEEVKGRPIVPDVIGLQRLPPCCVSDHPMNLCGVLYKAYFGGLKCGLR